MTTAQGYKAGQRARRAEAHGDELASRALFRDVVREATRLQRRGQGGQAQALCAAFERGHEEG
jgi:hypothetical protein